MVSGYAQNGMLDDARKVFDVMPERNQVSWNALIAMYFKCGSIQEALEAFEEMEERDVVSWNTMIMGYARHGLGKESLRVFDTTMRTTNTKPDDITMVGVLSACSHAGLVEKGISYFYSMHRDFGVTAKPEHYTCMIDLLGRAGRLEEARDFARLRNAFFEQAKDAC